jgi:hypothetical protein
MKAKVFISWSGAMSQAVARALRDWLPSVIQAVEPWMSEDDIGKGIRWSSELAKQLEQTRVGVICLTPENLESPWIHFEAGALSKTLKNTHVCPYLFELKPVDISGPLAQFQLTRAEKEDTRKLVHTINEALDDEALTETQLDKYFDRWWPDLEQQLEKIARTPEASEPQRSDREILEEILESVRGLKRVSSPAPLGEPLQITDSFPLVSSQKILNRLSENSRLLEKLEILSRSHPEEERQNPGFAEAIELSREMDSLLTKQETKKPNEDATSNDT